MNDTMKEVIKEFEEKGGAGKDKGIKGGSKGMLFNDEEVIEEIKRIGKERAKAIALSKSADESKRVILSEQMNLIESTYKDVKFSESKLERLARASKEYKKHLELMARYRMKMLQLESNYEAIIANKSFLRDRNSSNVAKMSQGIF